MPKKRISYNRSLLDECIQRDSPQSVEIPEKLNRDVKIKYVCDCGKDGEGSFTMLKRHGIKCKDCKGILAKEKMKQTMLKRYGVDHAMKSNKIKEKIKQTCLDKYGVDNSMKSIQFREKEKNMFR
jgi:hypothetical protein